MNNAGTKDYPAHPMNQQEQLDDEPMEAKPEEEADHMAEIERFAEIMKGKRKDAIEGRRSSGIELQWTEDEDHYEDRESTGRTWEKGRNTTDSPREVRAKTANRSSAFVNITRPYCDAASAQACNILMQTDDRNWAFRNTPKPGLTRPPPQQSQQQPGQPGQPQQQPPGMLSKIGSAIGNMFIKPQQQQAELLEIDYAKETMKRAQTVVDDWLVEGAYNTEARKVIECTARMGAGVLKGPHPARKKARVVTQTPDGMKMTIEIKTVPTSKYVSLWNFYPDPNCGEYIADGSYTCERSDITAHGLRRLKGGDFLDSMIDLCIEEGPIQSTDGAKHLKEGEKTSDKDMFEIWYIYCQVSKKEMEAAGCECSKDELPAIVTMVNDRIIQISMSPLDSGEFPYDVMVWQAKLGHWAGIGIARQIRTCQKGLNGAVRAMQDNSAISSGPQYIIDTSKIEPADTKWVISPNKIWKKKLGSEDMSDVRAAFTIITIETRQVELLNIINYWTKTAEDVTGLPMLLQGQQGNAPDTLGATQIVTNNASTVLKRIARTYDDRVTAGQLGRYYEWLLLRGPEDAKGEFQVEPRGSSALIERDMQNQARMQLLGISLNPAYLLDPVKTAKEVLRSMKLDSKAFAMDEQQIEEMKSRQPPQPYQVQVAQVREQGQLEREKLESQQVNDRIAAAASLEMAQQSFEASENEKDRLLELAALRLKEQLDNRKTGTQKEISLDSLKSMLASVSMKLNTQVQLSNQAMTGRQALPAPSEPAGRAPNGQSYQR